MRSPAQPTALRPKRTDATSKTERALRTVVGYVRVSTEEQAEHGVSLDAQRHRITAYAEARGYELKGIVEDAGLSGTDNDRPGLTEALRRVAEGEADAIVVTKLDRLSRDLLLIVFLGQRMDDEGWSIISIDEGYDFSTPHGRMMAHLLGTLAQYERGRIVDRIIAANDERRRRGDWMGAPPYGWRWSETEKGRLAPEPSEAPTVALVHDLAGAGLSHRAIARELNERAIPTREVMRRAAGKKPMPGDGLWSHKVVGDILARKNTGAA